MKLILKLFLLFILSYEWFGILQVDCLFYTRDWMPSNIYSDIEFLNKNGHGSWGMWGFCSQDMSNVGDSDAFYLVSESPPWGVILTGVYFKGVLSDRH